MNITGNTKVAGVMGWPVSHSKSPALHGFWLREHGIDGIYIPLAVKPENLRPALKALPMLGFMGVNLTVPHKENALNVVDEITPIARRVGAVNAIVVGENGRLWAENTDVAGFMTNLRLGAPEWDPTRGPAVVLGAGGASRAVCVGLIDAGCPGNQARQPYARPGQGPRRKSSAGISSARPGIVVMTHSLTRRFWSTPRPSAWKANRLWNWISPHCRPRPSSTISFMRLWRRRFCCKHARAD